MAPVYWAVGAATSGHGMSSFDRGAGAQVDPENIGTLIGAAC
ncbi:hypothetical protein [Roseateles sp.]|nr:hypothetical protein [Roseateles sp.]